MLILLPPSETKRDGGAENSALDLHRLSFPSLGSRRRTALAAMRSLARNRRSMATALGLGPTQGIEIERNRGIRSSPVMPALLRYTGVLYDALDAPNLSESARGRAHSMVVIHSALFGLLGADDPIPAYRLSHDSHLPGVRLRELWSPAISAQLRSHDGLVLDLRSEAYVGLGPAGDNRVALRVVTEHPDGRKRALTHFNKRGKGEFVRAVLEDDANHGSVESLLDWAETAGIRLACVAPGELELTVDAGAGQLADRAGGPR